MHLLLQSYQLYVKQSLSVKNSLVSQGALQSRSSVKTYCALTYNKMEWAGVFDNNFYTVFCLKGWKSCPAVLHNLVLLLMSKSQSDRTRM